MGYFGLTKKKKGWATKKWKRKEKVGVVKTKGEMEWDATPMYLPLRPDHGGGLPKGGGEGGKDGYVPHKDDQAYRFGESKKDTTGIREGKKKLRDRPGN